MPTLLSPRGAATKTPEDEGVVKKPKGVMGRIKSTLKLGRRKSSTGSASATAAAAATSVMASNDKEDAEMEEPAFTQNNGTARADEKEEEEEEVVEPYKEEDTTEIKHFTVVENDDNLQQLPALVAAVPSKDSVRVEPESFVAEDKNNRVATFLLQAKDEPQAKEEEEEADEVFACDYQPGEGPQVLDDTKPQDGGHDDDDEVVEVFAEIDDERSNVNGSGGSYSGNQSPPAPAANGASASASPRARGFNAPHESDLMVVGVSPAKFHKSHEPSLSPVKRSQSWRDKSTDEAKPTKAESAGNQESTGPSRADTEATPSDRSTRQSRQPPVPVPVPVPSSPVCRAQLLSDFQFGTDAAKASNSPVPSSPMKRRTNGLSAASLSMRRSFQREQEQQLSINATTPSAASASASSSASASASPAASPSLKRKPDTPSAAPSTRTTRPERRNSLQGICEEETHPQKPPSGDESKLLSRPSAGAGRRRAASAEAPILASSFVATYPEVHDDHEPPYLSEPSQTPSASEEEARGDAGQSLGDEDGAGVGAIAFDVGAAITHEFGERIARLLGADPWGDRQDGFDAILYQVKKTDLATAKNRRELFCAAVAAVKCGVDDRVAPVMYCALDCLRGLLKEFATVFDRAFLKYPPMNEQLSALAKTIVSKLGDSNKRTQREASQAVVRLAKLKKLKVLPHVLLHLSAKEVAPRQRVETLRLLVKELGVDHQTAMNVEVVMQFAVPVLKIADEKTRKAAVELIAELHMVNGQAVNAQLTGVKPEMLRVINRRVDELLAKREQECQENQTQAVQNANQAEDDDRAAAMALVAVPLEDAKAVHTLMEAMHQQAQTVVGPVVWRKLESKTWSDRKEALVDIEKTITEAKSDLRDVKPAFNSVVQHNFLAYCTVVYRCLSDAIAPVVNSAMDAFSTLIKVYGPCVEWREDAVRDLILLTIMRLISTMQKPNNRTNRAACRCVLKLTRLTNPHTLRYAVSCVFAKETDALVQMHLLRLLVPEFGFQSDGISAHHVLELVAPALGHSSDKVRKTATDVALCTQRLVGKEFVLKKLQDVVKPVTLKELEKHFVDLEVHKDGERPQTVHATAVPTTLSGALPPVQFGGDQARRQLNSAPVGVGKLHCSPPHEDERESIGGFNGSSQRRASVLSNDEENFMNSILGDDF